VLPRMTTTGHSGGQMAPYTLLRDQCALVALNGIGDDLAIRASGGSCARNTRRRWVIWDDHTPEETRTAYWRGCVGSSTWTN